MWPLATFSEICQSKMKCGASRILSLGLFSSGAALLLSPVYKTQKQVLAEVFPGGGIERKTVFLTPEQVREVEERAKAKLDSKIVSYYRGLDAEGKPAGWAFFDNHVVRTMPETVLILIDPEGRLARVEILAFHEPEDYKVKEGWLDRMRGKRLDDDLAVGRGLVHVTGATLSVQALAGAVRRTLALHLVISGANLP